MNAINKSFAVTLLTVETVTAARRRHDNVGGTIARLIRTPVFETAVTAPDMATARNRARDIMTAAAPAYALPLMFAVNIDATADAARAARAVAYRALSLAYSRQALPFMLDMMNSIISTADARDVLSDLTPDAADVVSVAALAMCEAAADATTPAPLYMATRAAYAAVNRYLHSERARVATTAREDINHYLRVSDDAADRDAAADYDSMYGAPAADADARAIYARAEYIDARRDARDAIMAALDRMTPKQRDAMRAYAEGGNMRAAARRLHLKSVATVAKHIQTARRAVNGAPIDLGRYENDDARRAARAADAAADFRALTVYDVTATPDAPANTARAAYVRAKLTARENAITARAAAVEALRAALRDDAPRDAINAAIDRARAARAAAVVDAAARADLARYDAARRHFPYIESERRARADRAAAARREYETARAVYVYARDRYSRRRAAAEKLTAAARAAVAARDDDARAIFDAAHDAVNAARADRDAARAARADLTAARRAYVVALSLPADVAADMLTAADARAAAARADRDAVKQENTARAADYARAVAVIERDARPLTDADDARAAAAIKRRARRDAAAAMAAYMEAAAAMEARARAARDARRA